MVVRSSTLKTNRYMPSFVTSSEKFPVPKMELKWEVKAFAEDGRRVLANVSEPRVKYRMNGRCTYHSIYYQGMADGVADH